MRWKNCGVNALRLAVGLVLLSTGALRAENPTAIEIAKNMQKAFFYQGAPLLARVTMVLTAAGGSQRLRDLTMLRVNMPQGNGQKYFMYFHSPGDVRGMTLLVYKYPDRESDRWLFIPALNMVQRIAARDAHSSFVGSDFSYEDVSGRNVEADAYTIVREEDLNGKACFVIESLPQSAASYKKKLSWIGKANFLPLKEEYYDVRDQLVKVFMADEIRDVDGIPTVVKRTMKNVQSGHQTTVEFAHVQYHQPIKAEELSERTLRNPPSAWIR